LALINAVLGVAYALVVFGPRPVCEQAHREMRWIAIAAFGLNAVGIAAAL